MNQAVSYLYKGPLEITLTAPLILELDAFLSIFIFRRKFIDQDLLASSLYYFSDQGIVQKNSNFLLVSTSIIVMTCKMMSLHFFVNKYNVSLSSSFYPTSLHQKP